MTRLARHLYCRLLAAIVCMGLVAGCATSSAQGNYARFDREALDAMVAPIALYPDPLLSQVLMAATYPREIDEAAQWSRARPGLSGDAAVRSSEGWDWDPSVRSLLAFPLVLDTMARYPRWTEDLGDAFLAQPEDVMDAVQDLRRRAYDNGTLRSSDYVRVVDTGREILIEPAAPQLVYVPYYDPRVVYGAWWWPARAPVYWSRWPGYADYPGRVNVVHWGPGISVSSGFFFGGFAWPRHEVRVVNVNTYYYTRKFVVERQVAVRRPAVMSASAARDPGPGVWRHDASRRRGPAANDAPRSGGRNDAPPAVAATPPVSSRAAAPPRAGEATAADRWPRRDPAARAERGREPDAAPRAERATEARTHATAVRPAPQGRFEPREDAARTVPDRPAAAAAAGNAPSPRRAERQADREEPRGRDARNREDQGQGGRRAQAGGRDADRSEASGRQADRSRGAGSPDGGRPMWRGGNERAG